MFSGGRKGDDNSLDFVVWLILSAPGQSKPRQTGSTTGSA